MTEVMPRQREHTRVVVRTVEVPHDGPVMTGLRIATYLLVSIASVLFIAVVVVGYVKLGQAASALDGVLNRSGLPALPLPTPPPSVPLLPAGIGG